MTNIIRKALSEITVPEGRRSIDHAKVSEIADSIRIVGKLLQPLGITENDVLVYGRHRLAACKLLGHDEIDCIMLDGNDWQIELAEIDENFIRRELDPHSRGKLALRRDEILEAQGLRAKVGQGRPSKNGADSALLKTTAMLAKEAGMSERSLQEDKQIARDLVPKAVEAAKMIGAKKDSMLKLSRKSNEEQEAIAQKILDGEATTIPAAISAVLAKLSDEELNDRINRAIVEDRGDSEALNERSRRKSRGFVDDVRAGKYDDGFCKKQIRKITKTSDTKGVAMKELLTLFLDTLGCEKSLDDKETLAKLLDSETKRSEAFTARLKALRDEFPSEDITSTLDGLSNTPQDHDNSDDIEDNDVSDAINAEECCEPPNNDVSVAIEKNDDSALGSACDDSVPPTSKPFTSDFETYETTRCKGNNQSSGKKNPHATSDSPNHDDSGVALPTLIARGKGYVAKGRLTGQGDSFVVLAGSTINQITANTMPPAAKAKRQELQSPKFGVIKNFAFKQDHVFSSASAAAAVIGGRSVSAKKFWKS